MQYVRPVLLWSTAATHRLGFGWGNSRNGGGTSSGSLPNNSSNSGGADVGGYATATEFVSKAAALKRRLRGRGQYEFARREAERFLEAEVPQSATHVWMEKGTNALALSQLLSFFEIDPDATLLTLVTNKLVRLMEDTHVDGLTRLHAAIALSPRGEQYMERIFVAVEGVLQQAARDNAYNGNSNNVRDLTMRWNIVELAAKVMQRNGKHAPSVLNESLSQMVMAQLERTPATELPHLQVSLLRVYGWMVRVGKVAEANHLLFALVEHTGDFHGYDFSTLMSSCLRHHLLSPLPLPLLHRMARVGLMYATNANGRDVASILASFARMLGSLEAGKDAVTQRDVGELGGRMSMLLEEYEPRVLRLLDSNDKIYWTHCDDITSIAFAYEMGGRLRYRHVFVAYQGYVANNVTRFEPQQLAMASGILRRSHLLSRELAVKLGERIETVLGEFSLSEISHICATFVSMAPAWMPEAKVVAARLLNSDCSSYTRLMLTMAFPEDDTLHSQINYKEISSRQLVDAMTLAKGVNVEGLVIAELTARLSAAQDLFSPDDLRVVQASGRQDLLTACTMYLSSRFAEAEWTTDTLYSLPLASGIPHARDSVKALAAAKAVSISPEQYVSLVELLTSTFGEESDEAMVDFVLTGGVELLGDEKIQLRTVLRYLEAVRPLRKMHPNSDWIALFNEKMLRHTHNARPRELQRLLSSLREVYGEVAQQPLLQQTVTEIVRGAYSRMAQPDEEAAQTTVLLAQLQHGMPNPPLTELTPLVAAVRDNAAMYPTELRDAVLGMSFPKEVEPKRVGRFTLRAVRALGTVTPAIPPPSYDVNVALDVDPFGASPQDAAADATSPPLPLHPPAEEQQQQQQQQSQSSSTCNAGAVPVFDTSAAAFVAKGVLHPPTTNAGASEAAGEAQENVTRASHNVTQEQLAESASVAPPAVPTATTPATHSGTRLWHLFGTASSSSTTQREPATSTPPVVQAQPSEEPRATESPPGLSYMKLFDPGRLPNTWHNVAQPDPHASETANSSSNNNNTEEQLRPRRTNLPRLDSQASSTDVHAPAAVQSSFALESPRFGYDGWSTSENTAATNTASTSGWASSWSAIQPPVAPAPGNSMAAQHLSWLSPHMPSSSSGRAFGGDGSSFGVSAQQQQQQQPQQQQQRVQSAYRMTPRGGVAAPGNHLFVDPVSSPRSRPLITKKNLSMKAQQPSDASSLDEDINQMYAKTPKGANEGVSNFMRKAGLTKITAYNMSPAEAETGAGDRKGFWADVIGQSVRRSKGDSRRTSKKPNKLSEWLNAPPKHAVAPTRKGRATSPPPPPPPPQTPAPASAAKGKSRAKRKRGGGKDHASAAAASRGKGAHAKVPTSKATKAASAKTVSKGAPKASAKSVAAKPKRPPENKKMTKKKNEKKPVVKKATPSTSSASASAKHKTAKKAKRW
ncbi:chaperonin containing t-complex protein [Trypanosoma rangeli]|uniref:Chaperonin containing t-complex protein n=1 Tax=Trypanosoma rangeli TaxID=5698 RepID=A0A422P4S6_TRYRA|nr:chaperonin containing t-complex protein [Trypanosoma rangeli]RNF12664.1 chaperonin containing t-complex protein [Trypanosoma rangeli]|eukprot:RNF12664.1 chaperonin containing t-complex protein [Trypanosoma rangeli]